MATQQERSETTRGKLLAAARKLFRARGYAGTFIDAIVASAGVTKGAFYHHFTDKKAVFVAVLHETERKLMDASAAGARGPDAWSRFRAGCRAFLEASMDPAVQRIVLRDGPAVLGWETWREIDARYSLGLIGAGLGEAVTEGRIPARSIKPLAHILFGALCEGAMMVSRSPRRREALSEVMRQIDEILVAIGGVASFSPSPTISSATSSEDPAAGSRAVNRLTDPARSGALPARYPSRPTSDS